MSLTRDLRQDADYEILWDIVSTFGEVMEYQGSVLNILGIRPESELKHPKSTIYRAIATLILIEDNIDVLYMLITAYRMMEYFYPDEVYNYFKSRLDVSGELEANDLAEQFLELNKDEEFSKAYEKIIEQTKNSKASSDRELEFLFYLAERGEIWKKFKRGYEEQKEQFFRIDNAIKEDKDERQWSNRN